MRATSSSNLAIFFSEYVDDYKIDYRPQGVANAIVRDETKIFVTAEPPEQYDVTFEYPDNIPISVYTQNDTDSEWAKQELSAENKISVAEGTRVRFSAVTQDVSKGFFIGCMEDGNAKTIGTSVSELDEGDRKYTYDLGALVNGDVSVKISTVNVHNIRFDTGEEDNINLKVCAPISEYRESGEAIKALTAIVPDGYELRFQVSKPNAGQDEDYQATASADDKEIPLQYDFDSDEVVFKIMPTKDMPKASYTLKVSDGYKADLTYTAKQLLKDADGREDYKLTLRNANIKGKENDFLKYVELDTTGAKPILKLKEGTTAEQIAELKTKAQKDNLTGYIFYEAKCGDNGYGKPYTITGSVKIKVTLK